MIEFFAIFSCSIYDATSNMNCATTNNQKNKKYMTIGKSSQRGTHGRFPHPSISFCLEMRSKWIERVVLKEEAKLWPVVDQRSHFENDQSTLKMCFLTKPSYRHVWYMQNCTKEMVFGQKINIISWK